MTTTAVRNRNLTPQEKQVQRGAAWLDRVSPGWWEAGNLNLSQLDVADSCMCVLGQVVGKATGGIGEYTDAVASREAPFMSRWRRSVSYLKGQMPRGAKRLVMSFEEAGRRGFHAADFGDYATLTAEWRRLIQARRREANAAKRVGR